MVALWLGVHSVFWIRMAKVHQNTTNETELLLKEKLNRAVELRSAESGANYLWVCHQEQHVSHYT